MFLHTRPYNPVCCTDECQLSSSSDGLLGEYTLTQMCLARGLLISIVCPVGDVVQVFFISYAYGLAVLAKGENARLQTLGNAVLAFLCASHVFSVFSGKSEGVMTEVRAALINAVVQQIWSQRLRLSNIVLTHHGLFRYCVCCVNVE